MRIPIYLFTLLAWPVVALDLQGYVQWNEQCRNLHQLGQAKVVLDNGISYGGIRRDGGFTIPNVLPGTYILSVISHDHVFDKLRVDIPESESPPEVRPYIPGTPVSPASAVVLPYPIVLSPTQKLDFFMPHQAFSLVGMFKNPMMLMMLVGGGMVFLMPYLMKNMDPEVLQDFEKRQAKINNIQSSLQSGDLKSGFSALMSVAEEEASAAVDKQPQDTKASPSGLKHRGGKNKKRLHLRAVPEAYGLS
ncbi:hypothetical protein NM688_g4387 [Phlebia brevispora]|uniref:Uncharacterized protein n=1 Tax=Phlebia brevispora TaxID=194682 RepID=A0ACC1T339_9APHY|nr:hypothetical protein NM688_g4387 [Phlebia brevispora]